MQMMSKANSEIATQHRPSMAWWNKKQMMRMIDIRRHQWAHIHHRMRPKKINWISIIASHQRTTMPYRIVINSAIIYCRLPFYCHDRGTRPPMSSVKCYIHRFRPAICYRVRCAKHHLNLDYFGSILIGIIRATVPFARCYNVVDDLHIRILCGITWESNMQSNGIKWKRWDLRVAHLAVLPISNDQLSNWKCKTLNAPFSCSVVKLLYLWFFSSFLIRFISIRKSKEHVYVFIHVFFCWFA